MVPFRGADGVPRGGPSVGVMPWLCGGRQGHRLADGHPIESRVRTEKRHLFTRGGRLFVVWCATRARSAWTAYPCFCDDRNPIMCSRFMMRAD